MSIDSTFYELIIAIPTIRRSDNIEYIHEILDSWLSQIPKNIKIFVYDQSDPPINIISNHNIEIYHKLNNSTITDKILKHKIIIHELLKQTLKFNTKYVAFVEDDFVLCKDGMNCILQSLLHAEKKNPDFSIIELSSGNNFLVQFKDIPNLMNHIQESFENTNKQIDHCIVQYINRETDLSKNYLKDRTGFWLQPKPFKHIGFISTQDGHNWDKNHPLSKPYFTSHTWMDQHFTGHQKIDIRPYMSYI